MKCDLKEKYTKEVMPKLIKEVYKNKMAVPKIEKVTINVGTGSVKDDNHRKYIENSLAVIAGQHFSKRLAKKSIASFKVREGGHVGYSATLRGKRMYDFLNKLVFVAIPRKRDFRGLSLKSVDEAGNLTIGFKDHLIFPEMANEDVRSSFGFSVTIVTTAKGKEKAKQFLKEMGFPFSKK
ncbi:50S ribosomal protein L5 [Patescibacteria group bacterium]|nr:50S ribosomal protein L5 [Patescibacteria group bacterium]MBU2633408.1 50S ribosomal protein L5 [Patescibacteria group bacterium]